MSLTLPPSTSSFGTRARYVDEKLHDLFEHTSNLSAKIFRPPPHHWTTVTYFKPAHVVLMRDLADLRQLVATLLFEEAQILQAQVMEAYQKKFQNLRTSLSNVNSEIGIKTVVEEIVT
ncbi:hypothetical protein RUND412_004294 [Rhizina undulata]